MHAILKANFKTITKVMLLCILAVFAIRILFTWSFYCFSWINVFKKRKQEKQGRKHNMFLIALYLILLPDLILPYESPEQVLTRESIPMIFGRQLQQIKFWAGKRRVILIPFCCIKSNFIYWIYVLNYKTWEFISSATI